MSLNPADIATVSRLLDEALALPAELRDAWLAALPGEHQRHADTLRQMLAREAELDTDSAWAACGWPSGPMAPTSARWR